MSTKTCSVMLDVTKCTCGTDCTSSKPKAFLYQYNVISFCQLPAFKHGDNILNESSAACLYLEVNCQNFLFTELEGCTACFCSSVKNNLCKCEKYWIYITHGPNIYVFCYFAMIESIQIAGHQADAWQSCRASNDVPTHDGGSHPHW